MHFDWIINVFTNTSQSCDKCTNQLIEHGFCSVGTSDGVEDASIEDSNSKTCASPTIPFNAEKKKTAHFSCKSTNPPVITPGHTGFLTFATLFPTL